MEPRGLRVGFLPRWIAQKVHVRVNDVWVLIATRVVNFDYLDQAAQNQQNPVAVVDVDNLTGQNTVVDPGGMASTASEDRSSPTDGFSNTLDPSGSIT